MALWSRGGGARPGGICGSPLSSEDEEDVFTYDELDIHEATASKATKSAKKQTSKPTSSTATAATKRRRAGAKKAAPGEGETPATKLPRVMSKRERVRDAPQRFVEYLAEQLAPAAQTRYCEEFGVGQGVMLRFPRSWSEARERREFAEWAQQLGFVASSVHRHLYRISSLNVEIVQTELRKRVEIPVDRVADDGDVSMTVEMEAEPEPDSSAVPEKSASTLVEGESNTSAAVDGLKKDEKKSLEVFKEHFERLDQEELEMLSVAEHDRLLSTIRHEQIADAMEEVLARPSVRKERDRARRMSKLGRIAERRLSVIPMRASIMPSTIMEDEEWEDYEPLFAVQEEDEEDYESGGEQGGATIDEGADAGQETAFTSADDVAETFDSMMVTPRKSPRRTSTGSAATLAPGRTSIGEDDFTTPRRSPRIKFAGNSMQTPVQTPVTAPTAPQKTKIQTPLRTPTKAPLQTPMKTPLRTPMKTPRRSSIGKYMPMGTPRRSPIAKATMTEFKRWRFIGRNVLNSLFQSGFLGMNELKVAFNVSKMWRELSIPAYAWSVADYSKNEILPMEFIYGACPRGHYLSDGAYKEVFKVFSARYKRLEAVSVMDIRAIESTGNQHIVRQEVAHSLLLSELVRSKVSPHFIEIYGVFLARERPQTVRWGSANYRKPVDLLTGKRKMVAPSKIVEDLSPFGEDSLFQYIHMEFCDGGDVENFIGLQDNKLLPVNSVVLPFFFQMVFSIYSARERLNLRHCDIKLLNFFLKDINRKGLKCAADEPLTLQYAIGHETFNVQMPATFSYWVKLADYGTADSNVENLGKPVTLDQFTTLENTPIEFLLEGDLAEQSFAADTFSLGLCFLHLFTGSAPYEEILEDVKCPAPLLLDLKRLWMSAKKNSSFSVLRRVGQDDYDDVLVHTLYRYLVLFGLPLENPSAEKQIDRVWGLLLKHLRPEDAAGVQPPRQSSRRAAAAKNTQTKSAQDQFADDQAKFNLDRGNHTIMKRARERLARVPGARGLLLDLVAFNPAARPTMKSTLLHDVFKTMRVSPSDSNAPPRPVHYKIDCYAAEKIPVDRLLDV